ncbi:MAG: hypothetical protein J6A81_02640 [Peptococcaceae bacterium]|nr:hypothetical protein [Peptococcaceae bacterium]
MLTAVMKNKMYYIHSVITVLFMFGFQYLPPIGSFNQVGMQAIGIFIGTLYGWTFVDMMWPSLLCLIAVVLSGTQGSLADVFLSGFGANVTTMTIFILALAAYFEKTGLTQYLANWFLSRKCNVGHPWVFTFVILFCAFAISLFTNNLIGMIITWGIIYNIAAVYGYQKKDKYIVYLICGTCMSAAFSCIAVPFQMMSVIFLNALYSVVDVEINSLLYTALGMSFALTAMGLYILIGKFIVRPNVTPLLSKDDKFFELRNQKMSKESKVACVVLVVFLLALFLPSVLPKWGWVKVLSTLGITGSAVTCLIALSLVKTEEGRFYIDINKIMTSGINWNVIILLAATGPMVNLLESDEAGVIDALLAWITPIISNVSPYLCLVVITAVLGLATQVAHNMVLGMVFIPVLAPVVISLGINPLVMTMALIFALQNAYATPASSTQAAIAFGNTEWVDTKNAYLCMISTSAINLLAILLIFIPLIMKIFA